MNATPRTRLRSLLTSKGLVGFLIGPLVLTVASYGLILLFEGGGNGPVTTPQPLTEGPADPGLEDPAPQTLAEPPEPQDVAPRNPSRLSALLRANGGEVQSGQTVASLLGGLLSGGEILDLEAACKPVYPLSKVQAGRRYVIYLTDQQSFAGLVYQITTDENLVVVRRGAQFSVSRRPASFDAEGLVRASIEPARP